MADDIEQVTAKMPPGQRSKVQEAVNEYVQAKTAKARQALRLIEMLEDLDDVQRVTANFEIPEEVFAEVAG